MNNGMRKNAEQSLIVKYRRIQEDFFVAFCEWIFEDTADMKLLTEANLWEKLKMSALMKAYSAMMAKWI